MFLKCLPYNRRRSTRVESATQKCVNKWASRYCNADIQQRGTAPSPGLFVAPGADNGIGKLKGHMTSGRLLSSTRYQFSFLSRHIPPGLKIANITPDLLQRKHKGYAFFSSKKSPWGGKASSMVLIMELSFVLECK